MVLKWSVKEQRLFQVSAVVVLQKSGTEKFSGVCGGGSGLQQSTHETHICLYTGCAALWVVHCLNKHVALAVRLQCQMPTDEMYEGFVVPKPH